jgi:alkaline phosphatase D
MNRRRLIGLSGAFAASCAIGSRFARSAGGGYPFTLGVASGQPSPDGFVIWTRLAVAPLAPDGLGGMSEPATVAWEVAADDGMRNVLGTGTQEAHRGWAHCVHIEVRGLEPGRAYWYRFIASGEASPVGLYPHRTGRGH